MASYFQWAGGIFGSQGAQTNPNLQNSGMLSKEQLLQLFKEFSEVLDRPGEEFCINVFFKIGFGNVNHFCDVSATRHLKTQTHETPIILVFSYFRRVHFSPTFFELQRDNEGGEPLSQKYCVFSGKTSFIFEQ